MISYIEKVALFIPIVSFVGALVILIIRLFNLSKIEILLEDKFKKKLYIFLQLSLISIVMAFSISAISLGDLNLPSLLIDILVILFQVSAIYFMISIPLHLVLVGIYLSKINKGTAMPRLSKVINYNNLILFILLIYMQFSLNQIVNQSNTNSEVNIYFNSIFAFLYLILILLINYIGTQSNISNREHYQVRIIQEEINKELEMLFFLYALGKDKLIFIKKEDANKKDLNKLSEFYVYDTNNILLMKFELYKFLQRK